MLTRDRLLPQICPLQKNTHRFPLPLLWDIFPALRSTLPAAALRHAVLVLFSLTQRILEEASLPSCYFEQSSLCRHVQGITLGDSEILKLEHFLSVSWLPLCIKLRAQSWNPGSFVDNLLPLRSSTFLLTLFLLSHLSHYCCVNKW